MINATSITYAYILRIQNLYTSPNSNRTDLSENILIQNSQQKGLKVRDSIIYLNQNFLYH